MKKGFVFSIAIVLLFASSAWAFLGQGQGFHIGAANKLMWYGGVGTAQGGNTATVGQEQEMFSARHGGTYGIQKETGVFVQSGTINNVHGPSSIEQNASIGGLQGQGVTGGCYRTTGQTQGLCLDMDTVVSKPWGVGGAGAAQGFVGGQSQIVITPTTASAQSQFVGAAQYAGITAGPNNDPLVDNSLDIQLGQNQSVAGGSHPH